MHYVCIWNYLANKNFILSITVWMHCRRELCATLHFESLQSHTNSDIWVWVVAYSVRWCSIFCVFWDISSAVTIWYRISELRNIFVPLLNYFLLVSCPPCTISWLRQCLNACSVLWSCDCSAVCGLFHCQYLTVCPNMLRRHPLCLFSEDALRFFSSGIPFVDS